MLRVWLVLVLTVAGATAWAQPAGGPATAAATARAEQQVAAAGQAVERAGRERDRLRQRLDAELAAVDQLKHGPRGWRTKRQLEERLSEANETRKQLEAAEARLARERQAHAAARGRLVAAIDAELAAGAPGPRVAALAALRAQHVPRRPARRIVLPDIRLDQGLDPIELAEQARAILESEQVLEQQIRGLDDQARELQRTADLRRQHDRTLELDLRDDNASRRTGGTGGGDARGLSDAPAPAGAPEGGGGVPGGSGGVPGGAQFELEAAIVLPEVVAPSVIDGIAKAQLSRDPGKRAAAVRAARDAVAEKQRQLRQLRREIEKLASQRR